jgi:hypothetical protein
MHDVSDEDDGEVDVGGAPPEYSRHGRR